ncbi:hypothetical protein [Zavarzinia sp.]|uniref:hypothetical protein n=1 Tax=Zavarzinia sp. TaxID=2027920 RepID=UPI003567C2DA
MTLKRSVLAALGLALAVAAADAALAQQTLNSYGQPGAAPAQPPFARVRAMLQAQYAATPSRTTANGDESQKMYEGYLASIGKGGAGPAIGKLSDMTSSGTTSK